VAAVERFGEADRMRRDRRERPRHGDRERDTGPARKTARPPVLRAEWPCIAVSGMTAPVRARCLNRACGLAHFGLGRLADSGDLPRYSRHRRVPSRIGRCCIKRAGALRKEAQAPIKASRARDGKGGPVMAEAIGSGSGATFSTAVMRISAAAGCR